MPSARLGCSVLQVDCVLPYVIARHIERGTFRNAKYYIGKGVPYLTRISFPFYCDLDSDLIEYMQQIDTTQLKRLLEKFVILIVEINRRERAVPGDAIFNRKDCRRCLQIL